MITTGETAPEFEIPGTSGEEIELYSLSTATEVGAAVLAFYPFDFSPVCRTELCEFRDAEWLTVSENVDVFGVSQDSCYAHREFIAENRLTFPLLSDSTGRVTRDYGVDYDSWELHEGVSKRAVVVIDETQTVRYCWSTENAYDSPNLEDVYRAISDIKSVDLSEADDDVF